VTPSKRFKSTGTRGSTNMADGRRRDARPLLQLRNLFDGIQSVARGESIAAFIPDLELLIAEAMASGRFRPCRCGGAKREVALVRAYGFRDVEAGLKVTTDTQFLIGSITKSFTSTGLALFDGRAAH